MAGSVTFDLAEKAQLALSESPIYALRDLRVENGGEQLLISGRVTSFYQKQMAQEVVRAVAKGMQLCNLVRVGTTSHFGD